MVICCLILQLDPFQICRTLEMNLIISWQLVECMLLVCWKCYWILTDTLFTCSKVSTRDYQIKSSPDYLPQSGFDLNIFEFAAKVDSKLSACLCGRVNLHPLTKSVCFSASECVQSACQPLCQQMKSNIFEVRYECVSNRSGTVGTARLDFHRRRENYDWG